MKKKTVVLSAFLACVLSFTIVVAGNQTAEERGKAHFNNQTFAGGKKACSTCHPDGRGLKNSGTKTKFSIMGAQQNSLEEVVNICIVNANKGTALEVDSTEMQEITGYIKSLGSKTAPGYGK